MPAIAPAAQSLRSFKNALQDFFPGVKSSHLSEALAAALGFRSHAALLAAAKDLELPKQHSIDEHRFIERLLQFGYMDLPSFSFDDLLDKRMLPSEFKKLVGQLLELEVEPQGRSAELARVRRACATIFADEFDIGYVEPREKDKDVVVRLSGGVDHKTCQPGWGREINTRHSQLHFPGSDHMVRFWKRLPLSNGDFIEYNTAIVSMPYVDSDRVIRDLPQARDLAQKIGWQCNELRDWTWYAAKSTTLVLFRRSTSHEEVLQAWNSSFKRWVIENKKRLLASASSDRRIVINSVIDCEHLPLNVHTWEELRERYLKEFAYGLYADENGAITKVFQKIFEKWSKERAT